MAVAHRPARVQLPSGLTSAWALRDGSATGYSRQDQTFAQAFQNEHPALGFLPLSACHWTFLRSCVDPIRQDAAWRAHRRSTARNGSERGWHSVRPG